MKEHGTVVNEWWQPRQLMKQCLYGRTSGLGVLLGLGLGLGLGLD